MGICLTCSWLQEHVMDIMDIKNKNLKRFSILRNRFKPLYYVKLNQIT